MGAGCNDGAGLVVDDLPYSGRGEGQRASDLARVALDFYRVPVFCRGLVGDVYVGADAGFNPVVPRGNGHAADPVDERGRDGAMNAAVRIDVILGQQETARTMPLEA